MFKGNRRTKTKSPTFEELNARRQENVLLRFDELDKEIDKNFISRTKRNISRLMLEVQKHYEQFGNCCCGGKEIEGITALSLGLIALTQSGDNNAANSSQGGNASNSKGND